MASSIPAHRRTQVKERERGRCARCGIAAPHGEWHHRRSRSVVDVHQHCSCNGVWLCGVCHRDVHTHPIAARAQGFIVSRHEEFPGNVVLITPWGRRENRCNGTYRVEDSGDLNE